MIARKDGGRGFEVVMDRSRARSDVYNKLSMVVSYPKERVRSSIMNGRWQKGLQKSLNMLDEAYFSGCFEDFQNACSTEKMANQREMADKYERLFGGSLPDRNDDSKALASMRTIWSFLRDKKREGAGSYDDFNRVFKKTLWPLSDMLCRRFRLMGILAELESNATGSEKIHLEELQLDFVSRFIAPSVPEFCEALISNSSLDFYRAVGILTREFVKFEENYLGIPEEIDTS